MIAPRRSRGHKPMGLGTSAVGCEPPGLGVRTNQQSERTRPGDGCTSIGRIQLGKNVGNMTAHGAPAEGEKLGDLLIGLHCGHELKDFPLPGGQLT